MNIWKKFEFLISQGSVPTGIRRGGYCRMGFVANFMRFPAVQNFWKSVKIWQSYRKFKGRDVFETQCRTVILSRTVTVPILCMPYKYKVDETYFVDSCCRLLQTLSTFLWNAKIACSESKIRRFLSRWQTNDIIGR